MPEDAATGLILLTVYLTGFITFLIVVIWSINRHREPRLRIGCDEPLQDTIRSLAGLTHATVMAGNAVDVFENGAFFDALIEAVQAASRSVHFETYLWEDGAVSRRVSAALAERARAGVQVRVLVDDSGGKKMGKAVQRVLQEAGCKLQMYHPTRLRNIGVQNRRDHRKLVVLDGRSAFLGGHCIKDQWLGNAQDKQHFRDVSLRLRGPVVQALQSTFSENWVEETGELFVGENVFPELEAQGDVAAHVARVKPEGSAPAVKIMHHLVICLARRRILIQNPYFLPMSAAITALGRAVARGVDVRVMVPAADASDMPVVQHAAHRNFDKLLASGVRIFEYQKTLLHQKVITVDGVWCAIGSSNFDDRSFEINDEISVGFQNAQLAGKLEEIFSRDALDCVELKHGSWTKRGFWHRVQDNALYLLKEQL